MLKKPDFTTENVVSAIATILEEVRYLVLNSFHMFSPAQSILKATLYTVVKFQASLVSGITEVVPLEIMTMHHILLTDILNLDREVHHHTPTS